MKINLDEIPAEQVQNLRGGKGTVSKKTVCYDGGGILRIHLPVGASIGEHAHTEEFETVYILSGRVRFVCNGMEEVLSEGMCHHCPKGASHTIENIGDTDLELFAVFA